MGHANSYGLAVVRCVSCSGAERERTRQNGSALTRYYSMQDTVVDNQEMTQTMVVHTTNKKVGRMGVEREWE